VNDEEVTEYYHRGVVCHLVGYEIPVPLDMELTRPGEGEVSTAKRLLERVFQDYPRFFDAIVADAAYIEAPFFNFCIDHGKYVVAVLKKNFKVLLADAEGLFESLPPQTWKSGNLKITYWDAEGFESAENIKKPLRVLQGAFQKNDQKRACGRPFFVA